MREVVETTCLEAFSDGVFAVAITLLALGLVVPNHDAVQHQHGLLPALAAEWEAGLAYILSFPTILVMWVNHHKMFVAIRRTDHIFLLLNGSLLFAITTFRFVTSLLATYLAQGDVSDKKAAQFIYSGVSLAMAISFIRMRRYASSKRRLIGATASDDSVRRVTRQFAFGPPIYLATMAVAFVSAELSLAICIGLAIFFALPGSQKQGAPDEIAS